MSKDLFEPIVTIVTAIVAVALVAVLVSRNADTGNVLAAFGSAISNMLSAATGPVTGSTTAPVNNLGSSSNSLGGGLQPLSALPSVG